MPSAAAFFSSLLGVSRSAAAVAHAAGGALTHFFIMDELQDTLSAAISGLTGAEAGTAVHCVAASITLSIAAVMTGLDQTRIASLPDTQGLSDGVIIPAGHAVNYGHPIVQDIRLAGATPTARAERDPAGMPFSRACLVVDGACAHRDANALTDALRSGKPSIWVMEHRLPHSELVLELVQVSESELDTILRRLSDLLEWAGLSSI